MNKQTNIIIQMNNNKVKIKMHQYIIQKIYHQVGMENQFHIGYINYMDLVQSINVKYVEIIVIGDVEHFKCIFNNGDIHMV